MIRDLGPGQEIIIVVISDYLVPNFILRTSYMFNTRVSLDEVFVRSEE